MASQNATQHWRARNLVTFWDHDPDTASAQIVTPDANTTLRYVDMKGAEGFVCIAKNTVLSGAGITKLEIVVSAATTFSSVNAIKDSGTVAINDLNDWVILEVTAEELAQASSDDGLAVGSGYRYAAGRLTVANSADEAAVMYILYGNVFSYLNLTAATTTS